MIVWMVFLLLASPRGRAEKGRDLQGVASFVIKYLGRY